MSWKICADLDAVFWGEGGGLNITNNTLFFVFIAGFFIFIFKYSKLAPHVGREALSVKGMIVIVD